ncbi:MAG TPA: ATP-grasp domain-containing protein [Jatrophihabitantaceae bacterium]|jgi:biotin carboxylase
MQRCAVVVDPVSTGQEYPAAFAAAGVPTVAVLSSPLADRWTTAWHPENFAHVHHYEPGNVDALAATLRSYDPLCVIPGTESGVEFADQLVELVLPGTGNVPEYSAARRDKWQMAQAVIGAGIPHPRLICSADPEEIGRWLNETGLGEQRFVLKPPKSASTDNVHIVTRGTDWRPFFDQIYGQTNITGIRNDAVIVEEYLDGPEYLIDSYSVDGKHGLVDVCRYNKVQRGNSIGVYDLVNFLAPDHVVMDVLWPYTTQVLDALGIRNGCAHAEVIVTADGPRLVEVGARPAGGGHQMISKLATGSNHILRTVAHRVRGEFEASYDLLQHVCSVVINSPYAGVWRNSDLFDDVETLRTYWMKQFYFGTGDVVPAAASLATMLGWVVLAHDDEDAVMADYRQLKALESQIVVDAIP